MVARKKFRLGRAVSFGVSLIALASVPANSQELLSPESQKAFRDVLSRQSDGVALQPVTPFTLQAARNPYERVLDWNRVAMEATAADHARGPDEGYDQLGPHRTSRAMAIVHIAIYDAVNAITKRYQSYTGLPDDPGGACVDTAISAAASETLKVLFPKESGRIAHAFDRDQPWAEQACAEAGSDAAAGSQVGKDAAKAILDMRATDMAPVREKDVGTEEQATQFPDKFVYIPAGPGQWQPDPVSGFQVALGYDWGKVTPFALSSEKLEEFKPETPPLPTDPPYAALYNEAKLLGGADSTTRKPFETFNGIFWAYDGTPGLCAPPRLYNQVALELLDQNIRSRPDLGALTEVGGLARYLALINTAMADAGIAAWEAKWRENYWRPVTAVRYADDGNPETDDDPAFTPLGAPATNGRGPNFTPPFPGYPSGHAAFGGALFQVLREIWGENTSFTFVSDEFNGLNQPADGSAAREFKRKEYSRLSEPEWENARSRIWLGIHWQVDADAGVKLGNNIGKYVYETKFLPR